jgi:tetratricopeptide (TPR) repeat protein
MGCAGNKSVKVLESDKVSGDRLFNQNQYSQALIHYRIELDQTQKQKNLPSSELLSRISSCLDHIPNKQEVLNFYIILEKLISTSENEAELKSEIKLLILNKLCDLYFQSEKYEDLIILIEKTLKIINYSLNPIPKDLLQLENRLALSHKFLGNFSKALEIYNKIIEKFQEQDLENVYGNLGCCHLTMGNLKTAEEFFLKSFESKKKNDSDLTGISNNLAVFYFSKGDFEKALSFVDQSLKFSAGKKDVVRAKLLSNKAACLMKMMKFDESFEVFKELVSIFYGLDLVNVEQKASFYNNYLIFLNKTEKNVEFSKVFEEFHGWGSTLTKDSFGYSIVLNSSSLAAYYRKDYAKALEFLMSFIDLRMKFKLSDHFQLVNVYNNVGALLMTTGKSELADQYFEKAMNILVE